MNKLEICEAIVGQLQTTFTVDEYDVRLFPEEVKMYQMVHPNGAILVKVGTINSLEPNGVVQSEMITIVINFLTRTLYNELGLYNAEIRVRQSLDTIRFGGAKLYLTTQSEAVDTEEGVCFSEFTYILPQIYITE